MSILLTDDEIRTVLQGEGYSLPMYRIKDEIKITKTQLKKVAEWMNTPCMEHSGADSSALTPRRRCGLCLTALLSECE